VIDSEYNRRIKELIAYRGMTHRAAKIVVEAAMYGIGCTEGKVRAAIEYKKQADLRFKSFNPLNH
jgi:hypothetical protein